MTAPTWSNERRKLSALIPWPRNPRQIKGESVRRLQESFEEFGQPEVIAISPTNEVYNGHQRLKSWFAKFGDIEVDVRVASRPLTEKERERLTVLLHRGAVGEWNFETLANEFDVGELLEWGFDGVELGLDGASAGNADAEPQIDRAAELNEKWQVQPGDLWRVGEHRLICGDCTDASVVARVMGGDSVIDLLATDPPFAITGSATGTEDMSGINIIQPFFRLWIANFANMLPLFGHAYICCDFRTYSMIDSTAAAHLALKNCIVWYKGDGGLGAMYQNCHELVWFGVRQERRKVKVNKTGQRTINGEPNVWRYTPPTFQTGKDAPLHTANKPLEMFERMIINSSDAGDIVGEPFLGSGTTLIACENLGRRCRAMEIAPGYVAVALERMATAFPGIVIERVGE